MKFNPFNLVQGVVMHTNPVVALAIDVAHQAIDRTNLPPEIKTKVKDTVTATVPVRMAKAEMVTGQAVTVATVKSAWVSKINWVQFAGPVASVGAAFGLNLSPDQVVALVVSVQTVQSIATWIIRTWFTHSISAPSAAAMTQIVK